jgi:quercetin dioxygenase-like cupin family protein
MKSDNGFKVGAGETRFGKHLKMKGVTLNVLDLKVSSQDTDGELAVFEQNGFTPKGGPPLHIHFNQDEIFHILAGEYKFQVGDTEHTMKQGDTIFLPRNIPHAFVQLSKNAKVMVAYQPAGKMEDFFKVTDAWTSPPTKEEIEKVFEDHEMKVVGPPLKSE